MDRKIKKCRRIVLGIGVFVMTAVFTGCAGEQDPKTAETLLQMMEKESEFVKSMKCNLILEAETGNAGSASGVKMDLDMETDRKSEAVHAKGQIEVNVQGGGYTLDTEIYQTEEKDETVSYTNMQNTWSRSPAEDAEIELSPEIAEEIAEEFAEEAGSLTLEEETAEVNGKACYKLTGAVAGDVLEGAADAKMLNSLGLGGRLTEGALEQMRFPCEILVYQEELLPARIFVDLKESAAETLGFGENEINTYYMDLTILEYNTAEKVQVPEEVRTQVKNGPVVTGIDQFTAEDVGEMDAASKSEALGESWDSYTVQLNDAVVTLPCAAADLEAAGLKMDQSVTAEDQTVEIGEYITGYYNDTVGNRLKVTLVNPSAEALPVSQCLIGSISVDTKALEAGGLTVQFPGGVQIGSLKEDVLKKYGECEDVFENESVSMYTWHDAEHFFRSCQINFDPDGKVLSMQMNCQE